MKVLGSFLCSCVFLSAFAADITATVTDVAGCPRIALNGQPVAGTAVIPSQDVAPGASVKALKSFADVGIRFSSDIWTMSDSRYRIKQWWLDEGSYDWSLFDQLAKGLLDASADGFIFPRIKIDPPKNWLGRHPEERCPHSSATFVRPDSTAWRQLYRGMLRDVIAHVGKSDYANRVVGYQLGALSCGEWLIHPELRESFPATGGDVRDPLQPRDVSARRRKVIDDVTRAVAAAAVDASKALREIVGRQKLIGGFFGYVAFSHEQLRLVLNESEFDFFAAPPHYGSSREVGQPGGSQAYFPASFQLHGKVFYEESDFRTFLSDPACTPEGMTRRRPLGESVNLIRRSVGKLLCGGYENWWFLLGGNRTFDDPKMMESIRIGTAEERRTLTSARWQPAEVAVFTSADEYATSYMTENLGFRHECKVRLHLEHLPVCGVPYDSYELGDIADPRLPDYKVYVFPNAFTLSDEMRAKIKDRVRRAGKTAIWVYAPGYFRCDKGGVDNVRELTGLDLSERYPVGGGLCSRQFVAKESVLTAADGSRSVYFPLPPNAAELREAFRAAGAHVWLESEDVLTTGRGYVMIHAVTSGEKHIRLPECFDMREIFDAEAGRTNIIEIATSLSLGETRVYRLERRTGK